MKNKITIVIIVSIGSLLLFAHKKAPEYLKARRDGGDARIVLSIIGDDCQPVSNATVRVLMGMNFRERAYYINGVTSANGKFVIEGKTTGSEIEIDVPKDVSDIRSHLAQMQIVWSNSVQEAYVIGTNACHETKAITNVFWRRTCMSNCLDAVVALPLQCHAKDMTSDYVFADIHQEEETAMEKRYYLVAGGCNLFGKEIADFTYD